MRNTLRHADFACWFFDEWLLCRPGVTRAEPEPDPLHDARLSESHAGSSLLDLRGPRSRETN